MFASGIESTRLQARSNDRRGKENERSVGAEFTLLFCRTNRRGVDASRTLPGCWVNVARMSGEYCEDVEWRRGRGSMLRVPRTQCYSQARQSGRRTMAV